MKTCHRLEITLGYVMRPCCLLLSFAANDGTNRCCPDVSLSMRYLSTFGPPLACISAMLPSPRAWSMKKAIPSLLPIMTKTLGSNPRQRPTSWMKTTEVTLPLQPNPARRLQTSSLPRRRFKSRKKNGEPRSQRSNLRCSLQASPRLKDEEPSREAEETSGTRHLDFKVSRMTCRSARQWLWAPLGENLARALPKRVASTPGLEGP